MRSFSVRIDKEIYHKIRQWAKESHRTIKGQIHVLQEVYEQWVKKK